MVYSECSLATIRAVSQQVVGVTGLNIIPFSTKKFVSLNSYVVPRSGCNGVKYNPLFYEEICEFKQLCGATYNHCSK